MNCIITEMFIPLWISCHWCCFPVYYYIYHLFIYITMFFFFHYGWIENIQFCHVQCTFSSVISFVSNTGSVFPFSAGGRRVRPGDELYHSGRGKHRLHGGAAGALWRHLPGGDLEHVHSYPAEERSQPPDQHRGGAHPAGAAEDELCRRHDCRWALK